MLQALLDICGLLLDVGEDMFCDDVTKNVERVLLRGGDAADDFRAFLCQGRLFADAALLDAQDHVESVAEALILPLLALQGLLGVDRRLVGGDLDDIKMPENPNQAYLDRRLVDNEGLYKSDQNG